MGVVAIEHGNAGQFTPFLVQQDEGDARWFRAGGPRTDFQTLSVVNRRSSGVQAELGRAVRWMIAEGIEVPGNDRGEMTHENKREEAGHRHGTQQHPGLEAKRRWLERIEPLHRPGTFRRETDLLLHQLGGNRLGRASFERLPEVDGINQVVAQVRVSLLDQPRDASFLGPRARQPAAGQDGHRHQRGADAEFEPKARGVAELKEQVHVKQRQSGENRQPERSDGHELACLAAMGRLERGELSFQGHHDYQSEP